MSSTERQTTKRVDFDSDSIIIQERKLSPREAAQIILENITLEPEKLQLAKALTKKLNKGYEPTYIGKRLLEDVYDIVGFFPGDPGLHRRFCEALRMNFGFETISPEGSLWKAHEQMLESLGALARKRLR